MSVLSIAKVNVKLQNAEKRCDVMFCIAMMQYRTAWLPFEVSME